MSLGVPSTCRSIHTFIYEQFYPLQSPLDLFISHSHNLSYPLREGTPYLPTIIATPPSTPLLISHLTSRSIHHTLRALPPPAPLRRTDHGPRRNDSQHSIHHHDNNLLHRRHPQPNPDIPIHQPKLPAVPKRADQAVQQPHGDQRQRRHDAEVYPRLARPHVAEVAQREAPQEPAGEVDEEE